MICTNCGEKKSWFKAECDRCGALDPSYAKDVWFVLLLGAVVVLFLVAANVGRGSPASGDPSSEATTQGRPARVPGNAPRTRPRFG